MLFTSYSFILFLAILFVLYYLVPRKVQWLLLLAANFVFYAFSGWDNVAFMLITILSIWLIGRHIGRMHKARDQYLAEHKADLDREQRKAYREAVKSRQLRWLLLSLFINLGILAVLKYTNFVIANINTVRGWFSAGELSFVSLALPMGISFYIFQSVGYMVDVYRGKYPPEGNILRLALFVSFFPQLVQGPISRFDDLSQTLFQEHPFDGRTVTYGLQRILWGFFKKLVIADRILAGVNTIICDPERYTGIYVLVGMLFYAIQLYADFTGGIDITIGIAQTLGIKVKENFDRPYFSKSIAEFWRRWHITMGTWFRDYVFYPLSISRPMLKLAKKSRTRFGDAFGKRVTVYLSTLIVWFTTGLWHGASWNFIVWGLLNGVVIILSQELNPFYNWFHNRFSVRNNFFFRFFQIVRTLLLMSSLRILDCYRDVGISFRQFFSMFTTWNAGELFGGQLLNIGLSGADYLVLAFGVALMILVSLRQRRGSLRDALQERPAPLRYALTIAAVIVVLVVGAYGIGYDSTQFIYNQF